MIRLFTSAFAVADDPRRQEFAECLERNLACSAIDEICLLVESDTPLPTSQRILVRRSNARPCYSTFFGWMSDVARDEDVSILANADIYFDSAIGVLRAWPLSGKVALALSRWETQKGAAPVLNYRNDSQDAWIFRGVVEGVVGDFLVGAVRCDNRIARELQLAGYTVLNPSFSLRAHHVHSGEVRDYDVAHRTGFVPPPYAYVWPHNLWSLPRTLIHNFLHRGMQVGWRPDWRRARSRLKLHRLGKGMRMLLSAAGIRRDHN